MADSLNSFFGGHSGAALYVNAAAAARSSGLKNSALEQLMKAGNYAEKAPGQEDSHIHQDFVDFFVNAGAAHAQFDVIRDVAPGISTAVEQVRTNLTPAALDALVSRAVTASNGGTAGDVRVAPLASGRLAADLLGDCANPGSYCGNTILSGVNLPGFDFDAVKTQLNQSLSNATRPFFDRVLNSVDTQFAALAAGGANVALANLINEVKADVSGQYAGVREAIVAAFSQVVLGTARTPGAAVAGTKNLSDAESLEVFMQVYGNWPDLSENVREFFRTNVSVLAKGDSGFVNKGVVREAVPGLNDGAEVRLTEDEIIAAAGSLTAGNAIELRLNLNKTADLTSTVFKASIPDAPNGTYWITDTTGAPVSTNVTDKDFLRKVYQAAYVNSGGVANNVAGTTINVNADVDAARDFNLNWPVFLRNVQAALDRTDCSASPQPEIAPCAEDLPNFTEYVDMAYGKVWRWDDDKCTFYRADPNNAGEKLKYDDAVMGEENCYGSYLRGDGARCKRVIQCLADGDPRSLGSCLDVLKDKDLWKVAADDVAQVNPSIVKTVLRKFHVRGVELTDDEGKKYKAPMTFEQWEKNSLSAMDKGTQDAIRGNDNLLTYLKGLIAVCDANPAIINKFNPIVSKRGIYGKRSTVSEYVTRLSKNAYVDPREGESEYAIAAAQLRALPHGSLMPSLFSPNLGALHNVSFRSSQQSTAMFGGAYVQNGGGLYGVGNKYFLTSGTRLGGKNLTLKDGSANIFEGLFKAIAAGLSDMGVAMNTTDVKRIEAAIQKLGEIEKKLIAIVRRLSVAVRIGETVGANHYVGDRQNVRTLDLETVRTNDGARRFMESHVSELRDAYQALHGHYSNIATDLVTHIYPRYLDRCCEKKAPAETTFVDLSEPCNDGSCRN